MASYPTFDNRWFNAERRQRQVRPAVPAAGPERRRRARPRPVEPDQPGHPGPVQHGLGVQGVHRLRRAGHGADQPRHDLQRPGHVHDALDRSGRCAARAGALRVPQLDLPARRPALRVRLRQRGRRRWPCRATRSTTSSARTSTTPPGTRCRTTSACSASAPTPASTCRSSSTGGCRRNELKARARRRAACSHPSEIPTLTPGDLLQMAIGQGLMAATPLQLAVGYGAIANGGNVMTPTGRAGDLRARGARRRARLADLAAGHRRRRRSRPQARPIPMPAERARPDRRRHRAATSPGPGANGRSTTAEELFEVGYPAGGHPGRRQDRHGPGPGQLPVERLLGVRRLQRRSRPPVHGRLLPGEGRLRLAGAAPVVKCMFLALAGMIPLDPVAHLRPARRHERRGRPSRCRRSTWRAAASSGHRTLPTRAVGAD